MDVVELSRLSVGDALEQLCSTRVEGDIIKQVSDSFKKGYRHILNGPADSLVNDLERIVRSKERAEGRGQDEERDM